jgi:hypothetical protein
LKFRQILLWIAGSQSQAGRRVRNDAARLSTFSRAALRLRLSSRAAPATAFLRKGTAQ